MVNKSLSFDSRDRTWRDDPKEFLSYRVAECATVPVNNFDSFVFFSFSLDADICCDEEDTVSVSDDTDVNEEYELDFTSSSEDLFSGDGSSGTEAEVI